MEWEKPVSSYLGWNVNEELVIYPFSSLGWSVDESAFSLKQVVYLIGVTILFRAKPVSGTQYDTPIW